jgi:hypothetical protein
MPRIVAPVHLTLDGVDLVAIWQTHRSLKVRALELSIMVDIWDTHCRRNILLSMKTVRNERLWDDGTILI